MHMYLPIHRSYLFNNDYINTSLYTDIHVAILSTQHRVVVEVVVAEVVTVVLVDEGSSWLLTKDVYVLIQLKQMAKSVGICQSQVGIREQKRRRVLVSSIITIFISANTAKLQLQTFTYSKMLARVHLEEEQNMNS